MKISNGMLVVIPRLMAVASQAVVQVDIARAAGEVREIGRSSTSNHAAGLERCARRGRPAQHAASAATSAISTCWRKSRIETIKTMHEVIEIEREVSAGDREREAKLTAIRDRLVQGMQGVNAAAVQR